MENLKNDQAQYSESGELYSDAQVSARSLAVCMPELAAQWNNEKNAPLTPEQVTYGSRKKVWWRCENGHNWQAMVKRRSQGTGCPVCANRMIIVGLNDWPSRFPAVAAQWDTDQNGCMPEQVRADDRKRY